MTLDHLVRVFAATLAVSLFIASTTYGAEGKTCKCGFSLGGTCLIPDMICETFSTKKTASDVNFNFPKTDIGRSTPNILDTGYRELTALGGEEAGYGLYSYAIVTQDTPRTKAFLSEVFRTVRRAEILGGRKIELNILYIPIAKDKLSEFKKRRDFDGGGSGQAGRSHHEQVLRSIGGS